MTATPLLHRRVVYLLNIAVQVGYVRVSVFVFQEGAVVGEVVPQLSAVREARVRHGAALPAED